MLRRNVGTVGKSAAARVDGGSHTQSRLFFFINVAVVVAAAAAVVVVVVGLPVG